MTELYKTSIPFKRHNPRNDCTAEFDILYNVKTSRFEKLIEFVEEYKDKRINILFKGGELPINLIGSIHKFTDNVYVRLTVDQMRSIQELKKNKYRYFLDANCPAYNFTMLQSFAELGITDVYLADDLWYCMNTTKQFCDEHNIRIRLVTNRIPATTLDRGINYKVPLFAPINRELLDNYVDAYEFDCGNPFDWAKFDVLYRAWFEREGWNGDLMEINDDLRLSFPLLAIPQTITEHKLNCDLRCKRPTNHCRKCQQYVDLGMKFVNMGAYIKANKRHLGVNGQKEVNLES